MKVTTNCTKTPSPLAFFFDHCASRNAQKGGNIKYIHEKGMVFGSVLAPTLTPTLSMPFAFSALWLCPRMEVYLSYIFIVKIKMR